ncbi:MAG: zinc-binding dehydrogenase [Bacteroidota bacterium]
MLRNQQLVITEFSNDIHQSVEIISSPIPEIGVNEVLIKNEFVGINAIYDRELYRGNIPYIHVEFPYVFGVEAVGTVVALGKDVEHIEKGTAVSTVKVGTAYQTYQTAAANELVQIPEATPEYLTLSPTGISAYLALEKVAELEEGETVVVSAAAGGLGHIIVQLCKFKNCHVIGICGSDQKVELLQNLECCNRIINYRRESVENVLNQEYANKIDVAFDSVGQHMFDAFLANLAPLGRLVVNGLATEFGSKDFQRIHAPRVYESIYWKGASVRCFMNHLYKFEHSAARAALFALYQSGQLQVKVDNTSFEGMGAVLEASDYLLAGKSCGKVVVKL